ncbi:MAG: hypothetical protein ACXVDW_05215, partial [Bacteroidia bacterium]
YLIYALAGTILILCIQVSEQFHEFNQKEIVVYNIPKTSAVDFITGKNNILLTDSVFAKNESAILFHIKHNWWELGLNSNKIYSENIHSGCLAVENNFVQFYDKRMVILNNKFSVKDTGGKIIDHLALDYLIVSNNSKMSIAEIQKIFKVKTIIFDSSNSDYHIRKWKEDCAKLNQSFYSVADSGALIITM